MNKNLSKKIFIIGAPSTGKSTYLGALWYSINQGDVETTLKLKSMSDEQHYLYELQQKWLEVIQLERTAIGQEKLGIQISLTDGNEILDLEVPEVSGETFQNIYDKREMSNELYNKILEADSILYFINVGEIHHPELISEMSTDVRNFKSNLDSYPERKPSQNDPTQIQIIDLLQTISAIRKSRVKLGIILSAWDLVENMENINPRTYLKENTNMLWQYIESNTDKYVTNIWGVSALGGKIEDAEKLVAIDAAIERIKVVSEKGDISHDLTSIIATMVGD